MKQYLIKPFTILICFFAIFLFLAFPAMGNTEVDEEEKETVDIVDETERQLAYQEILKEKFDDEIDQEVVDAFYKDLNHQIQEFLKDIPETITKIAIGRVDGDQMLIEGLNVRSRLMSNLYAAKKFELFDCDQCQKLQVSMKDNRLHIDTYIDSQKELQGLKKTMGVDAILRSHVVYEPETNKIQLYFILVQTNNSQIVALSQTDTRDADQTAFSMAVMPIISGFKVTSEGQTADSFYVVSFRNETDIFINNMKLGLDLDYIAPYPDGDFEGNEPGTIYTIVPFVSYDLPFEREQLKIMSVGLGIGKIIVDQKVDDIIKLELAIQMTKTTSFALVYFSSPEIEFEKRDTGVSSFQADGFAYSFRYRF